MQQIHLQTPIYQTLTQMAGDVWASFYLKWDMTWSTSCTLPASVHMHFYITLGLNMWLKMFNYSWSERPGLWKKEKKKEKA